MESKCFTVAVLQELNGKYVGFTGLARADAIVGRNACVGIYAIEATTRAKAIAQAIRRVKAAG